MRRFMLQFLALAVAALAMSAALTGHAQTPSAHLKVNPALALRTLDDRIFGVSAVVWDPNFNNTTTIGILNAAGNRCLRFPGGSVSDGYHWLTGTNGTAHWTLNFDGFANVAVQTRAQVFITTNYGDGSAQEAADWVRYSNITKNYGFKYWEVGNECYGTWESDYHNPTHDPYTYAVQFKAYQTAMKAVDPTIKVGAVIPSGEDVWVNNSSHPARNPRTGAIHNGWSPVVLQTLHQLGVTPDFVIIHRYEQTPYTESDAGLLQSEPNGWSYDSQNVRAMLCDYLGAAAKNIEEVCTENNSVSYNPGKQTTSLVNGLYFADSMGSLMKSEMNAFIWWNVHNAQQGYYNNSASLYGWRQYGDYGMLSPSDEGYPTFYISKMFQYFGRGGDALVGATSDNSLLSTYAARRQDGTVSVMVINKSPSQTINGQIALTGFHPMPNSTVYSYGIPQDNAARYNSGNRDIAQSTFTGAADTFTYAFAPYSVSILSLAPDHSRDSTHTTLYPTADAYGAGPPWQDFYTGLQPDLVVSNTPNNAVAFLKFDLSQLSAPPTAALLKLTVDSATAGQPGGVVKLYGVADTTWTEIGLTYNTMPSMNALDFGSAGTYLGSQTVVNTAGTVVSYDITGYVAAHPGQQITLQLIHDTPEPTSLSFSSRQALTGLPTIDISMATVAPSAPVGLTATPGNNQVTLAWSPSPGAVSYTLKRSGTTGGPYTPLPAATNLSATAFTDTTAQNGTPCYYVVTARNSVGESAISNEASATPAAPPPSPNRALAPLADALVINSQPDANFGSNPYLVVENQSFIRASYLKFDLAGVASAPTSALLKLTVNNISYGSKNLTVKVYGVADNSWTEGGLTWNNAPGLNRVNGNGTGTLITSQAVYALGGAVLTFDVTSYVASHLGQQITFLLNDESNDWAGLVLNSKESSTGQPVLALTGIGSTTPPPALPHLAGLSLAPASVVGGAASTATLTLDAPAPTGGAVISLSSNSAAATVPASVTVPGGATTATFAVSTTSVTATASVTLTAAYNNASKAAALNVTSNASRGRSQALAPLADALVINSQPDANFGNSPYLIVENQSFIRASYLKFDLAGVASAPASALLKLTVNNNSYGHQSLTVKVYGVADNSWTEGGLTWNNAPGLNRVNGNGTGTLLTTQPVWMQGGKVLTFDVTSYIASHLGQQITFLLNDESNDWAGLVLNSKESSTGQPVLQIGY